MSARRKLLAVAGMAIVAFMLAGLAFAAAPDRRLRFVTIAKSGMSDFSPRPPVAFVARSRMATARFATRLRPEHRPAVATVNFSRNAVIAAFFGLPTPCHAFDLARVIRTRRDLVVSVVVDHPPVGVACIQAETTGYQVVKVRRSALGRRPIRRVLVRVRYWFGAPSGRALTS